MGLSPSHLLDPGRCLDLEPSPKMWSTPWPPVRAAVVCNRLPGRGRRRPSTSQGRHRRVPRRPAGCDRSTSSHPGEDSTDGPSPAKPSLGPPTTTMKATNAGATTMSADHDHHRHEHGPALPTDPARMANAQPQWATSSLKADRPTPGLQGQRAGPERRTHLPGRQPRRQKTSTCQIRPSSPRTPPSATSPTAPA